MIKNPATEAKTLLELSLEQVFSQIEVTFFHRSYHGQSERKKKAKKRESEELDCDLKWIENTLIYFSESERIEVDKRKGVEVPSAEPSINPLIKRT